MDSALETAELVAANTSATVETRSAIQNVVELQLENLKIGVQAQDEDRVSTCAQQLLNRCRLLKNRVALKLLQNASNILQDELEFEKTRNSIAKEIHQLQR